MKSSGKISRFQVFFKVLMLVSFRRSEEREFHAEGPANEKDLKGYKKRKRKDKFRGKKGHEGLLPAARGWGPGRGYSFSSPLRRGGSVGTTLSF